MPDSAVKRDGLFLLFVELVEAHAGIARIELKVERRRLDGLRPAVGPAS
jgi:hypothetical protein